MKIEDIWQTGIDMVLKAACKKCEHRLEGEEKFCPECGKKLRKIPKKIRTSAIIELLNAALDKGEIKETEEKRGKKGKKAPGVSTGDDTSVAVGTHDDDTIATIGMGAPKCPYNHQGPSLCGKCRQEDGACTVTVLTSYPPKYNICPFRGNGYVWCDLGMPAEKGLL